MKNLKKFSALLLALVMMLSLSVTAFAADTGTISEITQSGKVVGDSIVVSGSSLQWYPADPDIGRNWDGWWVGVKITAPAGYTSGAVYNNGGKDADGNLIWKSFDTAKDGDNWMGAWVMVKPEWLVDTAGKDLNLTWRYQFKWSGDGDTNIQTFTVQVDPDDITLSKDGQVYFQTENGAVIVDERVGTVTEDGTGSITMNNAVVGETYQLYKVFDLTFSGEAVSYSYTTIPVEAETDAFLTALQGDDSPFTLKASAKDANTYIVELKKGKGAADVSTFLKTNQTSLNAVTNATTTGFDGTDTDKAADKTIIWNNLPYGYYFIDSSLGSLITVNSTLPNVTVQEKNAVPSIKKEVASDLTDDTYQGYGDGDVIDTINYKLTVNTGTNAANLGTGVDANYIIVDTLPTGITHDADSVAIDGWKNTDYTVTVDGQAMTIVLNRDKLITLGQNSDIIITYTATMNKEQVHIDAAGEATGNTNNVELTYKAQKSPASAIVYTYQIGGTKTGDAGTTIPVIQKVDAGSKDGDTYKTALNGVKFVLSKIVGEGEAAKTYYAVVEDNILTGWTEYRDEVPEGAPEGSNSASRIETKTVDTIDGVLTVKGLDAGNYILTEVETLPGYNLLNDTITVEIKSTVDGTGKNTVEVTYKMTNGKDANGKPVAPATEIYIENNTGTELPSTGGMGTTVFYIVGGVLVLGAAVLLVTKRRMNATK